MRAFVHFVWALVVLGWIGPAARADVMYAFSGTVDNSNMAGVPVGTAVSGIISYDPAAPLDPLTSAIAGGGTVDALYDTGTINAQLAGGSLADSATTLVTTGPGLGDWVEIGNYYKGTLTGSGPFASLDLWFMEVNVHFPGGALADIQLPSSLSPALPDSWLRVLDHDSHVFGIDHLTLRPVPEPSAWILLGAVLAGCVRKLWGRLQPARPDLASLATPLL